MRMRYLPMRMSGWWLVVVGLSFIGGLRTAAAQLADAEPAANLPLLNQHNFDAWRKHILPKESELNWQQIPWLVTFKDGILAANSAEKPLMLWTMNGHPLGCT